MLGLTGIVIVEAVLIDLSDTDKQQELLDVTVVLEHSKQMCALLICLAVDKE
jgi:hypothetical protein